MDRLSPQDLITLWPEQVGSPQDMGVLAVLDRGQVSPAGGRPLLDAVRDQVGARIYLTPRLRQVIHGPAPGLGRPVWVDAPRFDIRRHVREHPLPAPGDEAHLLATVEELGRTPLDPTQPLWAMWLLPGLADGRTGLYVRVHHALADAAALVALLGAILDTSPTTPAGAAPPWTPAAPPTARELFEDNLQHCSAELSRAAHALGHPADREPRAGGARAVLASTGIAPWAPRSSLNRPIGRDRRLVVVRHDLASLRDAAHRHEASINDVLLAAMAGGLGELLRLRGERTDGVVLRAIVPIALPHRAQARQQGTVLGQMIVPLPLAGGDAVGRLRLIARYTADLKRSPRPRRLPVVRSRTLQRVAMTVAAHQRAYNVYVANVRGPNTPLLLAGAKLLDVFPIVPLLGNLTLGVGALSYAGQLNILTVGDRITCPDVDVFTEALNGELASLTCPTRDAG